MYFQNWLAVKAFYSSYVIFEDVVWGLQHLWKFYVNWIALEYVENWTQAPEMQVSALCGHKHRDPASIQKSAAHPEGEPLQFEGCLASLQRAKCVIL